MKVDLSVIPSAVKTVFSTWNYRILGLLLSFLFMILYISVPVFTIPGNSYGFFLEITPILELTSIAVLAIIVGVVFTMQIYSWKNGYKLSTSPALGFTGLISGSISSIFSTATCSACVAALFSFLGFGGVLFMIEHRMEIIAVTSIIVLIPLFFTSRKIVNGCGTCKI